MVYLFHFELPVTEATWTNFATIYRPYLKSLTFSEVDGCASGVMHLSRTYGCDRTVRNPGGSPEDRGENDDNINDNDNDENDDDDDKDNDKIVDGTGSSDDRSEAYYIITFMSYFYVNTKKGKNKSNGILFFERRNSSNTTFCLSNERTL